MGSHRWLMPAYSLQPKRIFAFLNCKERPGASASNARNRKFWPARQVPSGTSLTANLVPLPFRIEIQFGRACIDAKLVLNCVSSASQDDGNVRAALDPPTTRATILEAPTETGEWRNLGWRRGRDSNPR